MKVVKFDDPYKRKNIETCEELYNIDNHYTYITNLFHQIDFSYNSYIHKELRKKHSSYKSQDKKKNRYDESQHITYEELIKNGVLKDSIICWVIMNQIHVYLV